MPASVAPAPLPARAKHLHTLRTLPTPAIVPDPTAQVLSIGLESVACAHALRSELRAAGIEDGDVAAALNVSASTASAMLSGARHLYLAHVRRLARRLPAAAPACLRALASLISTQPT